VSVTLLGRGRSRSARASESCFFAESTDAVRKMPGGGSVEFASDAVEIFSRP